MTSRWLPNVARVLAFVALLGALPAEGHIGSPDVFFEGQAGPWPVRVIVRPPEVVPGPAEISVRVHDSGAEAVRVQPVRWQTDPASAPLLEAAQAVPGDGSLWRIEPQLQTSGFYSFTIEVKGAAGTGTVVVPVHFVAVRQLELDPEVRARLLPLASILLASFVLLVGVGMKSLLEPGTQVSPTLIRASLGTLVVSLALIYFVAYRQDVEDFDDWSTPFTLSATTRATDGPQVLEVHLDDDRFQTAPPLVPDHGKLMHLFLIREPTLDAFAHLHPVQVEEFAYSSALPASLPAGTYRLYADVTFDNGIHQTLTTTVDLVEERADPGAALASLAPDPDDSWHVAMPQQGTVHRFAEGLTLDWEITAPLRVGEEVALRFQLRDETDAPVPLEPYMGMFGHAAVRRHDGAVFIHLHPTGTVSMASWQVFEQQDSVRSGAMEAGMDHGATDHGAMEHSPSGTVESIEFPYEFPRPGIYRLWIQVKSRGQVYTGVFDALVEAER